MTIPRGVSAAAPAARRVDDILIPITSPQKQGPALPAAPGLAAGPPHYRPRVGAAALRTALFAKILYRILDIWLNPWYTVLVSDGDAFQAFRAHALWIKITIRI